MRNSVKLRITIWYMISTALITVASVGLLFFLSKNMTSRMEFVSRLLWKIIKTWMYWFMM